MSRVESPSGKHYDDHYDDETIALLALGESVAGIDPNHLQACAVCQSQVDQLQAVVGTARSLSDEDHPMAPPDALWQRITEEIEVGGNDATRSAPRRGMRAGWFALAAAVGILVGSVGTVVVTDQQTPAPAIAQAQLQPLPGQQASGVALVRDTADGPVLVVDVPDLPQPDGYYEVWMLAPDAQSMVSIGVLGQGRVNEFPLPATMDMQQYPVVDISLEKYDGDVTHSSDSLVRGELSA